MMIIEIIISLLLFQTSFGMEYDEVFTSGLKYYNYQQHQTIKKRTFKLRNQNKDYFEITNYDSILTIYKEENQIAKLKNDKENNYYFKYDSNYNYYILFEFPDYKSEFYAFYVTTGDQELNLITSSSMTIRFAKKREFPLKIKNKESTPQLVAIRLEMNRYSDIESASGEVHGISFIPDYNRFNNHIYSDHYDTYYAIVEDEITFKPILFFPYTQVYEYRTANIYLINDFKILSKNVLDSVSYGEFYNYHYFQKILLRINLIVNYLSQINH